MATTTHPNGCGEEDRPQEDGVAESMEPFGRCGLERDSVQTHQQPFGSRCLLKLSTPLSHHLAMACLSLHTTETSTHVCRKIRTGMCTAVFSITTPDQKQLTGPLAGDQLPLFRTWPLPRRGERTVGSLSGRPGSHLPQSTRCVTKGIGSLKAGSTNLSCWGSGWWSLLGGG